MTERFNPPTRNQLAVVANGDLRLLRSLEALFQVGGIDVPALEDSIESLDVRVTTNEADILSLDGRVTDNEVDISTNAANIASNLASITTIQGDISGLSARDIVFVASKSNLPAASSGVITLEDNVTYWFTGTVDLLGDRIVCGQNSVIIGSSSENGRIKSTGLTDALITSEWTLPMRHITLEATKILDLDANGNANQALDWYGVNFVNTSDIGTIANYSNFVASSMAFLSASGLVLDGTFGTIGLADSLFQASSGTIVKLASTATITRRIRFSYSAVVSIGSTVGLDVSTSATIPDEGYILDTVSFSGGGTNIAGIDYTLDQALFVNNRGVTNTAVSTSYYMSGNATATTITTASVAVKVAGTTTESSVTQKFDNTTSNKALYASSLPRNFLVSAVGSLTAGNNNQISVYIAKNGATTAEAKVVVTANSAGRFEDFKVQSLISLSETEYVEVFVANESGTSNITVSDLNLIAVSVSA